jgi:hypothetical protein
LPCPVGLTGQGLKGGDMKKITQNHPVICCYYRSVGEMLELFLPGNLSKLVLSEPQFRLTLIGFLSLSDNWSSSIQANLNFDYRKIIFVHRHLPRPALELT